MSKSAGNPEYERDKAAVEAAKQRLRETGIAPSLQLHLDSSRCVWIFVQAQGADHIGDSREFQRLHQLMRKQYPQSLALEFLESYALEREQSTEASLAYLREKWNPEHRDIESPWGWLWQIEYHQDMRRYFALQRQITTAIQHCDDALHLAIANKSPTYTFSAARYGIFLHVGVGNHLAAKRLLDLCRKTAEAIESPYYLAHSYEDQCYFYLYEGKYTKALPLIRKARTLTANIPHSRSMDGFIHAELQILARLGQFAEFEELYQELQRNVLVANRGDAEFSSEHLAIERLEYLVAKIELDEAKECINTFNLKKNICCHERVLRLCLRLELMNPGPPGEFLEPNELAKTNHPHEYPIESMLAEVYRLKYSFKHGRWGKSEERSASLLSKRIASGPYPYPRLIWQEFACERALANGSLVEARDLALAIFESASRLGHQAEKLCFFYLAKTLSERIGEDLPSSQIRKNQFYAKRMREELVERFLRNWPYFLAKQGVVAAKLEWKAQRHCLVINGHKQIPLNPFSKLEQALVLLLRRPGKLKTYADLTQEFWHETYEPTFHDHKVQTLIFELKQLFAKHGLSPDIIQNVYGKGYCLQLRRYRMKPIFDKPDSRNPESRQSRILALLDKRHVLQASDLVQIFHYSARQAQRDLNLMVEAGVIVAEGAKKNRRYRRVKPAA